MNPLRLVACSMVVVNLAACVTWVKLSPGAENVTVADAKAVASCEARGTITVNVLNKVGPMGRDPFDIERELATLARNSAADSGADTVVENEPEKDGKSTFSTYKCRK